MAATKGLTGGILPHLEGDAAELRRLRDLRDRAQRVLMRWGEDGEARIEYARAQGNLDDFLEAHPELNTDG